MHDRDRRTITIAQSGGPLTVPVRADLTDADLRMIALEIEERHIKPITYRR